MEASCEQQAVAATAPAERAMRKWLVTLTVLGVGGVGAFLLTERGQQVLRKRLARFEEGPGAWNQAAQAELERIQSALNQIAQALEPHGEPGR